MQSSLISIILPFYNSEKYISHTIDTLINQTYQNIEIICVDDGSDDGSLQIVKDYAQRDSRIKLFCQNNKGPACARNLALANAAGEYIMFCDSDDAYEPQMCEKMLAAIEEQKVNLVMCNAKFQYEENVYREYGATYEENLTPVGFFKASDILLKSPSSLLWHKIFKKSVIDRYAISFPEGCEADDSLFCYEYFCVCETCYGIKDKLYNYLIRQNSIMDRYNKRKNIDKLYDRIRIFEYFQKFLKTNNLESRLKKYYSYFFALQFLACWKILKNEKEKTVLLDMTKESWQGVDFLPPKNNIVSIVLHGASVKQAEEFLEKSGLHKKIYGSDSVDEFFKKIFLSLKKYYTYYKI